MMLGEKLHVHWSLRPVPLAPLAGVYPMAGVRALLERELSSEIRCLVHRDGLILIAKAEALPWIGGVRYFGRDALAPALLLPTHSVPDVPLDLFEQCVRKHCKFIGPILVDSSARRFVGLCGERPFTHAILRAFLEGPLSSGVPA
jgi:hypothetical protein